VLRQIVHVKTLLTPRDLADAIGVSESSLKRWADAGKLMVTRTEGGHRRIAVAEAVRFVRASGATVVRPDLLGLPRASKRRGGDALAELLERGDAPGVRAAVIGRFVAGERMATMADAALSPALEHLQALGQRDARGRFVARRAADALAQALAAVRGMIELPAGAPVAVGGGSGDGDAVASLLVATVLAAEGLGTVDLGASTSAAALRYAVREQRPALVWLVGPMGDEVSALGRAVRDGGGTLVAIGEGVTETVTERDVYRVRSYGELAAFAKGVASQRR
jgi:hypothetical protein